MYLHIIPQIEHRNTNIWLGKVSRGAEGGWLRVKEDHITSGRVLNTRSETDIKNIPMGAAAGRRGGASILGNRSPISANIVVF
jgi:hypothetical protein